MKVTYVTGVPDSSDFPTTGGAFKRTYQGTVGTAFVSKINAAYAFGGAALAVSTVKAYLGISVNHVIEVNFDNFPAFIDSLGGIDYSGSCVHSVISGGVRNGGQTLVLPGGTHHLDGKQALTLARTRHNLCNPAENDLTRVAHQQQILNGIKGQLESPSIFFHLPWASWQAPKVLRRTSYHWRTRSSVGVTTSVARCLSSMARQATSGCF